MEIPVGQLTHIERQYLYEQILKIKPNVVLESGTWKGGGSTLAIVKGLYESKCGVLHTYEEHAPFYDIANSFYIVSEYSQHIKLYNEDIVTGLMKQPDDFFSSLNFIFLDGGDEDPTGHHKFNPKDYDNDFNMSENVQSFKLLENKIQINTHILLHDWNYGRGSYVQNYLKTNNIQNFQLINVINASTGLAHLIKIK